MPNVNIVAAVSLQAVDITAAVTVVNRIVQGIQLAGTGYLYEDFLQVPVAGITISLPNTTVWSVYVRNLGVNNVTVNFTPAGGASEFIVVLPSGFFWYHQIAETAGGITALSLTAAVGTTPVEVFAGY
jgi:hypothetical protein